MSFITFQCYACGKSLKVPADKAGKRAKCNQCNTILTIPAESSVPETPAGQAPVPQPQPQPGYAPNPYSQQAQPAAPPQEQAYEPAYADFTPQATPGGYPPVAAPGGYPPVAAPGGYAPAPGGYPPAAGGYNQYPQAQDEQYMDEAPGPAGPPKWNFVRLGLLLVFIGACVMAGAFALEMIGWLLITIPLVQLLSGTFPSGSGDTARILLGTGALASLGATLTAIVGYVFCMLGPNKKGSFGLSIAVLAIAGVEALFIMIFRLPSLFSTNFFGSAGSGMYQSFFGVWFMFLLIQLLFGAEIILFPLVARAFALGLKKRASAKSSMLPLSLAAAYTGVRLLTFIFWYIGVSAISAGRAMGWTTIVFLWLGNLVFIGFLIVYPMFLWRMRQLIPQK